MKYRFPLAYAATKVMANSIHEAMVPRRVRAARMTESGIVDIGRSHTTAERKECIRQIAMALPRLPAQGQYPLATESTAPIYEVRSTRSPEFCAPPLSRSKRERPAAVKRNGGLRGSTATKWKR